jgi:Tfp pilus assembly protein PilZ
MEKNLERRESVRIDQISPLKIKNLNSGTIYSARMFNFSKNGLYFESDSALHTGDQIYIGIQDSPYAASSGVLEYYRAEIRWHKKLKDSFFEYGYGVKLSSACIRRSSEKNSVKDDVDTKEAQKTLDRKKIKFTDQNKTYEGLIKDISSSGIFFKAEDVFIEGQMLTFEVPLKNGKEAKINGQIVWADDEGFGVVFTNKS